MNEYKVDVNVTTAQYRCVTALEAGRQVYKGTKMASEVEKNCKYTSFMSQSKSFVAIYATFYPVFFNNGTKIQAGTVDSGRRKAAFDQQTVLFGCLGRLCTP
jgi:hypothetical protein